MDNQRLLLFLVFFFSTLFLYQAWQKEKYVASMPPGAVSTPVPSLTADSASPPEVLTQAAAPVKSETIRVETDFLVADIDTSGGTLSRLELRKQRANGDKRANFVLFDRAPDRTYTAQSGLIGADLPDHHTQYSAAALAYTLQPGQDTVTVRLSAPEKAGVQVVKTYVFHRSSYVVDVGYEIDNKSSATVKADAYFQFVRDGKPPLGTPAMVATFTGAAIYTAQDKFHKVSFSDVDKGKSNYPHKSDNGWIALLQHYFLAAWLPTAGVPREFYVRKLDNNLYSVGVVVPVATIAAGQQGALTVPLYAGPQEQDQLAALAPGLNLTVDYGWLTIIAAPLFFTLQWLHGWVGNWGLAIILLTVIIKAVFYPLSAASYRSMSRMKALAPRLQKLKEHYADDRQRLNQAMMELYRTEKINPLGGCLPIVIQIPVFISLYWVLLASVELRNAPFIFWIRDLSAPDPYYILPLLMAGTMFIQTALNPKPPDPMQANVMRIMPIIFSVFFFFFPAGLVLYWLVNNVLSITQQWYINRSLNVASVARK